MSDILNLPSCFFIITKKERHSACVRHTFLMYANLCQDAR